MKKNKKANEKKKGFTLIELIGTILLISMLVLIITPTVNRVIKTGKNNADQQQIQNIILATRNWVGDHRNELPSKGAVKDVTTAILQEEGYLDKDIRMPSTNELIDGCVRIANNSTLVTGKQNYEYTFKNKISNCIVNTNTGNVTINAREIINGVEQTTEYNVNNWTRNPIKLIANVKSGTTPIQVSQYTWRKSTSNEQISVTTSNTKIIQLAKEEGRIPYYVSIDGNQYYGPKYLRIDTKSPTIAAVNSENEKLNFTITDSGSGIAGYQITDNKVKPTSWISVSNSPQTYSTAINKTPGYYYMWVKDAVENISSAMKVKVKEHVPNRILQRKKQDEAFWTDEYRRNITSVIFENHTNVPTNAISWDVSEDKDKGVVAWLVKDVSDNTKYVLHIGGKNGAVIANTYSNDLFQDFTNVTSINFGNNFDTSKVTNMSSMFYGCENLATLDISHFDTSKVTSMFGMFDGCKKLVDLDVSRFNTSKVTNMGTMFGRCENLTTLDVSHFDTSKVTNMQFMFGWCYKLISLDVSKWDTSNVTSMFEMFWDCKKLTNLDVSKWNTSKVTNMRLMFCGCESLTGLDVSHFDTSKVTDIRSMFANCKNLTTLDVSHFDTSNVTQMGKQGASDRGMFEGCEKLTMLDLSNFDTSKVTIMGELFANCTNLKTIYVSDKFKTTNVTSDANMFKGATKLVGGNGTKYSADHIDKTYARIDKSGQPGYFTKK